MVKTLITAAALAVGIVLVGATGAIAEPMGTQTVSQDCGSDMHWNPPVCP